MAHGGWGRRMGGCMPWAFVFASLFQRLALMGRPDLRLTLQKHVHACMHAAGMQDLGALRAHLKVCLAPDCLVAVADVRHGVARHERHLQDYKVHDAAPARVAHLRAEGGLQATARSLGQV